MDMWIMWIIVLDWFACIWLLWIIVMDMWILWIIIMDWFACTAAYPPSPLRAVSPLPLEMISFNLSTIKTPLEK